MPHPWNTADALDDSRVQVEHIDLVPPKYANVLNFRSIKTRDYYFGKPCSGQLNISITFLQQ